MDHGDTMKKTDCKKQVILFLLYGVIGGLSLWVLHMEDRLVGVLWFCLLGFGALFFSLERRTGLTAKEKYLPLLLLGTIAVWVQTVRYRSLAILAAALMCTSTYLFGRKGTFGKDQDHQDK